MDDSFNSFCTGLVISFLLCIIIIPGCVISCQRDEAVRANVGEYYINSNFNKSFRYKTNYLEK